MNRYRSAEGGEGLVAGMISAPSAATELKLKFAQPSGPLRRHCSSAVI